MALNRVIGNSASEILGSLSANGKVMLVNQNGILMGSGAQVNTGGFIGSTLNIKDSDFLAGRYIFDIANNTNGTAGTIINNGRINTPSGYAVLIAPQVTNNGFIAARQGTVAIGAGNKVSLDMVGDGLISLKVDQAALNAAIVNTGSIQANGGTVLLKASSANALIDTVINSTGIIRADSIANLNGRIILDGGAKGITEVTGEITARGLNAGETGGSINVLGNRVGLVGSGKLDASGDAGGGTVLVGGNWQGNGPERNASRTIVGSNASIDVSATNNGNGGTAVVWADGRTDMSGMIKARGGINGGNGGNVETSGKAALDLQGRVDVTAANGQGGQWLLDPNNINISNAATANTTVTGTDYQDDAGGTQANVNAAALGAALTGGNTVNVQTSNAGFAVGNIGEIRVSNAVTAAGAGTLNLIANSHITVNAAITNAAGQALNVGLYAGSNGTPATIASAGTQLGNITTIAAGTITTGGGKVTMVANRNVIINGAISTSGGDVTIRNNASNRAIDLNAGLNAGTGTVRLQSAVVNTSAGAVVTAANLGVRAINDIGMASNNQVSGTVALATQSGTGGAISFTNGSNVQLGQVSADGTLFSALSGIATITSDSGVTLSQAVGTTLTQDATLANSIISLNGRDLNLAGGGAFTLTNTTNSAGSIAATTGAGEIKYVNAGALNVAAITRTGNVALNTQTGNLNLTQNINATGNVVKLQALAGAINQTAGIVTASTLAANAGNGALAMGATSNAVGSVALKATTDVAYKSVNGYGFANVPSDGAVFSSRVQSISSTGGGKITLDTSAGTVNDNNGIAGGTFGTSGGLELKGNAAYSLTAAANSVGTLAVGAGTGAISYRNAGALEIGTVNTVGITRAGNVTLETGGALSQTATVQAANLQLLVGQAVTLGLAGNNIASLSGTTGALSLTTSGALALGALSVTGDLTLNTGGTVSQTGALTLVDAKSRLTNITATAGNIKLTNAGNEMRGGTNLSAAVGGVALTSLGVAISAGNITAATSMNSTNATDIANFTASDAALIGVVLLQTTTSGPGNTPNISWQGGSTKIVADRAVLVAAGGIGAVAPNGLQVQGAGVASIREVYLAAGTQTGGATTASLAGPATVPMFFQGLKNGATNLASPTATTYNGAAVAPAAATPAPAPAPAPARS